MSRTKVKAGFSSGRATDDVLLFVLFFAALLLLHSPLLRLPYFWDEAGYYIPAARDILLTGSLIPSSTLSNAHPPLLLAYLALAWKIFGYTPLVTRCAMLLVSAFCLLGVFRLARRVAPTEVAVGSVIALSLFPVYFAQSSLAHMDLGAAAFVTWGLDSYLAGRRWTAVEFFAFATLTKETAIIVPATLFAWELLLLLPAIRNKIPLRDLYVVRTRGESWQTLSSLFVSITPLIAWFAFHYLRTGQVFGNPDFFRYNLGDTLHPVRILAALGLRVWHLFGYMNMALLTAAVLLAMTLKPRPGDDQHAPEGNVARPRISVPTQLVFYLLILAHVMAFAVLGGAVLARYLLPVYPLVIIVGVSTLRRRLPWWPAFLAVIGFAFVVALITEPPYRFAPEDNLAYSDYVRLHQSAERFVVERFPNSTVLTAWPASDELMRSWLGYVNKPERILSIDNFSVEQLLSAADMRGQYQVALLFSTKEEPHMLLNFRWWERLQSRYFGYHRDVRPVEAAALLGGRIVFERHRGSQWIAVVALETVENASNSPRWPHR